MLVAYSEKYNRDTITDCLEKQVCDAPEWYDRDYMTLEEKNGKYYIFLSTPAKATGYARYRSTYRLYFAEKGIRIIEKISFFAIMMFAFFIPVMCICAVGMLLTGEMFMGFVCLFIFGLSIWLFGIRVKRNIKDFIGKKMQN